MVDTTDWHSHNKHYITVPFCDKYIALHLPPPRTPDAAAATECTDEHNEHQKSHSNDDNDAKCIHWGGVGRRRRRGEERKEEEGKTRGKGKKGKKWLWVLYLLCSTTKWFWHEHSKGSQKPLSAKHGMVTENLAKFGNEKTRGFIYRRLFSRVHPPLHQANLNFKHPSPTYRHMFRSCSATLGMGFGRWLEWQCWRRNVCIFLIHCLPHTNSS